MRSAPSEIECFPRLLFVANWEFFTRWDFLEDRKRTKSRHGRFTGAAPAGTETKRPCCEGSERENFDEFHVIVIGMRFGSLKKGRTGVVQLWTDPGSNLLIG